MTTPSIYERDALTAIHTWKNPELTIWDQAMSMVNKPLDVVGDAVLSQPLIREVVEKSLGGLLGALNDGAAFTVRPHAILKSFEPPLNASVIG